MFFIRIFGFIIIFFQIRSAKKFLKKLKNYPENTNESERFVRAQKIVRVVLWTYGVKPNYYNLKRLSKKPSLIVANHQSNLDALLIIEAYRKANTFVQISAIAKAELKKIPLIKTYLRLINAIFIDRSNVRSAIEGFVFAKDLINGKGYSIIIFPEGTRSKSAGMLDFKPGAFKIAYSSSCIVQPICIFNSFACAKFNIFRQSVDVKIMDKILPSNFIHIKTPIFSSAIQKKFIKELNDYRDN